MRDTGGHEMLKVHEGVVRKTRAGFSITYWCTDENGVHRRITGQGPTPEDAQDQAKGALERAFGKSFEVVNRP